MHNVFEDLGFDREESADLAVRADLMDAAEAVIKGLTQVKAAEVFGTTQPRISHLRNGLVHELTTDTLIRWLAHAGRVVTVKVSKAAA